MPSSPGRRWRVRLVADPLGMHSWSLVAGLTLLAEQGDLDLSFVSARSRHLPPARQAPWLDVVDHETRSAWSMCVDFADAPQLTGERPAMADVVLKRSCQPAAVPEDLRDRLLPYGLSYRCRSGREGLMLRHSLHSLPSAAAAPPGSSWGVRTRAVRAAWPATQVARLVQARRRPERTAHGIPRLLSSFETPPDVAAEPLVLFQTRVWPESGPDDHRQWVNEERAGLVRLLRARLGDRFQGGLQPSPTAAARYPDLVTTLPSEPVAFLSVVHRCAVVVVLAGLRGATAAQVPEGLAGSRALVVARPASRLPEPLVDGTHVSFFDDAEGCVSACEALLDAPDLVEERRARAWAYYQASVRPDVLVRNRLLEVSAELVG
jgi:hypothetical protein